MVTKEDIFINSTIPDYKGRHIFSLDVEFVLFGTIICRATIYKNFNSVDEICDEIVNYINSKLKTK